MEIWVNIDEFMPVKDEQVECNACNMFNITYFNLKMV